MIKQFFKEVLISYLIIICCIFTPTYRAYAASAGGWSFSSFDVATSVVTAMKNGASASVAVAKSPITSKIAKGIVGGAIAGAAIPLAISQITGIALQSVDWVLDPANNAIKYTVPINPDAVTTKYLWASGGVNFATPNLACANELKLFKDALPQFSNSTVTTTMNGDVQAKCVIEKYYGNGQYAGYNTYTIGAVDNPSYNPGAPTTEDKYLPIATVADKIYDNAKTDAASASIVNDAVKEYVNEGSADVALDAAKADADATHNCGTGTHWSGSACVADTPTTPSTPTTPDTPFDPTSIIDAIGKVFDAVMSIPDVINTAIDKVLDAIASITDVINTAIDDLFVDIKDFFQPVIDLVTNFFDWVKTTYDDFVKPGDNEPTELDIPNNVPTPTDTNISFGGMCPPNAEINVRIPYSSINATLFDWSEWCYNLETFVKPVIILLAAYFSVLIFRGKNESI